MVTDTFTRDVAAPPATTPGQPAGTRATVRGLVIVGSSRRKATAAVPVPALDLYQGWCVPQLRQRVAGSPEHRARILVLSGRHGLVAASTPLLPYDQAMTRELARRHQLDAPAVLLEHLRRTPADAALLLLEPHYLATLPTMTHLVDAVHTITNPVALWDTASAVLDSWGWP